jgi:hypothetical protein
MDLLSEADIVGAPYDSVPVSSTGVVAGGADDEMAGFRSFGGIEEFDHQAEELNHADERHESTISAAVGLKPAPRGPEALVEQLRSDIIGSYYSFTGPFGPKPCVYADWTASGRAVKQVCLKLCFHAPSY